jgi:ribosome-associated protein
MDGATPRVFYTIDTVRRFRREHPDDHLFFIVGADQFLELPTWKNYEALLDCCDFIIASRPGFKMDALRLVIPPLGENSDSGHQFGQNPAKIVLRKSSIYMLTTVSSHVSSTEIRDRLENRKSIHGLVPRAWRNTFWDRLCTGDPTLLRPEIRWAVEAAQDKQAVDITVLNLVRRGRVRGIFSALFGSSHPQIGPSRKPSRNASTAKAFIWRIAKGKSSAEWVLLDYGYFVAHIFSERAREYYDLERLWRNAERVDFPAAKTSWPAGSTTMGLVEMLPS